VQLAILESTRALQGRWVQSAVRLLSGQTEETSSRQRTQVLIERQVRRITQLVDDLLDVSRISRAETRVYRSSAEESP
jgi:signal transduction histidine kinase